MTYLYKTTNNLNKIIKTYICFFRARLRYNEACALERELTRRRARVSRDSQQVIC